MVDLRVSGEITSEQMKLSSKVYEKDLKDIVNLIIKKESLIKNWEKDIHDNFDFAQNCVERFKKSTDFEKKEILMRLSSNPVILDRSLYFSTEKAPSALLSEQFKSFLKSKDRTQNFVTT